VCGASGYRSCVSADLALGNIARHFFIFLLTYQYR
jgi:hypothetical protein